MQRARDLLADLAGLRPRSGEEFKAWQLQLQREAPEAYFAWVMKQGFSEKDRYHLQWLSKDMNEHERYIKDFIQLLDGMSYWGPGDRAFTQQQFAALPIRPRRILDMGCGRGASTMALAQRRWPPWRTPPVQQALSMSPPSAPTWRHCRTIWPRPTSSGQRGALT